MEDYIDILLRALNEPGMRYFSAEYFQQRAKYKQAERALLESLTDAQNKLYLTYEEEHNLRNAISERDMARQAFLLAKEIFQ